MIEISNDPDNWDSEVDLVVAGAGAGGLAAALTSAEAGLSVEVFEKSTRVGGGAAYSGGVLWSPNNPVMQRKGMPDSYEAGITYLQNAGGGRNDPVISRNFVETMPDVVEFLENVARLRMVIWKGQPDYYPLLEGGLEEGRAILPSPRAASELLVPAEGDYPELSRVRESPHLDLVPEYMGHERPPRVAWIGGRALIGGIWLAFLQAGIPYHFESEVTQLIREGDRIAGVEVKTPDGVRRVRARRGVLLNTGGFEWNEEWTRRYITGPAPFAFTPPSNTGDGHRMAIEAGAATALMDQSLWNVSIKVPGELHEGRQLYRMTNADLAKPGSIVVNQTGRRFCNESAYYTIAAAMGAIDLTRRTFKNLPCYLIVDDEYRAKYGLYSTPGTAADWVATAPSLRELAEKIGVNANGLEAEVVRYNELAENGVDEDFGRGTDAYQRFWGDPDQKPNPNMRPLTSGPYYAVELYLGSAGSRGGVVVTIDGQATDANGAPIAGLYVCGNVAAQLAIGAGYASGMAIGGSLIYGLRAARKLVSETTASTK